MTSVFSHSTWVQFNRLAQAAKNRRRNSAKNSWSRVLKRWSWSSMECLRGVAEQPPFSEKAFPKGTAVLLYVTLRLL
jgi:hypothetical protein